jgi:hypothetical protein
MIKPGFNIIKKRGGEIPVDLACLTNIKVSHGWMAEIIQTALRRIQRALIQ